jgi:hypothetical protein
MVEGLTCNSRPIRALTPGPRPYRDTNFMTWERRTVRSNRRTELYLRRPAALRTTTSQDVGADHDLLFTFTPVYISWFWKHTPARIDRGTDGTDLGQVVYVTRPTKR